MSKASVSSKGKKSAPTTEEIPIAPRETPAAQSRFPLIPALLVGTSIGLGAVALVVGLMFWNQAAISSQTATEDNAAVTDSEDETDATLANQPAPSATDAENIDNVLGHLEYEEADPTDLDAVTADGRVRLQKSAAQKFIEMVEAARRDGIALSALSGFRTKAEQESLFFDIKAERNQAATKRAEVSAPPGFSEHHTGYAIDIGDGNVPATNLSPDFENTPAFKWLEANAPRYNFELSFPRGNPQGIQYEPWHWRFVGDIDSLETFYRAQQLPADSPDVDAASSEN